MHGGAHHESTRNITKSLSQNQEISCPGINEVGKSKTAEECTYSTQDLQKRSVISALESLRAVAGSDTNKIHLSSAGSLLENEESPRNRRSFDDGRICYCGENAVRSSSGVKKIDEMMEYAIQNINEAEKALTNLGDNFEHDLKLMFMDIMGRVQHWVNVVQNRIHAARSDLVSLREESIARDSQRSSINRELITVRQKLSEAEANIIKLQKECSLSKVTPDVEKNSDPLSPVRLQRVSTPVQTTTDEEIGEDQLQRESIVSLINTGCQCEDGGEKTRNREAELEVELSQALEENERMVKEREEYESAIQNALLKGVSSLNTEALKVLRYPPIPCCNPCGVPSAYSDSPKSVVPCRPKKAPPQPSQRGLLNSVCKNENNDKIKDKSSSINCCQLLSENLVYCNGSNERSGGKNNTLFLLHHGDDGNQCQPCMQARCRSNGTPTNKGSVCVGGKCKKSITTTKQKVSSVGRPPSSRPASYDICVRSRDDSGENSTSKKNISIAKRCGTYCGNRRNIEE